MTVDQQREHDLESNRYGVRTAKDVCMFGWRAPRRGVPDGLPISHVCDKGSAPHLRHHCPCGVERLG